MFLHRTGRRQTRQNKLKNKSKEQHFFLYFQSVGMDTFTLAQMYIHTHTIFNVCSMPLVEGRHRHTSGHGLGHPLDLAMIGNNGPFNLSDGVLYQQVKVFSLQRAEGVDARAGINEIRVF